MSKLLPSYSLYIDLKSKEKHLCRLYHLSSFKLKKKSSEKKGKGSQNTPTKSIKALSFLGFKLTMTWSLQESNLWTAVKWYGRVTRAISYRQSKFLFMILISQYNHRWDPRQAAGENVILSDFNQATSFLIFSNLRMSCRIASIFCMLTSTSSSLSRSCRDSFCFCDRKSPILSLSSENSWTASFLCWWASLSSLDCAFNLSEVSTSCWFK